MPGRPSTIASSAAATVPESGDVVPEIRAVIDAGHDQLSLESLDQPEVGQPDAVDRSAVGGVSDCPVLEVDLLNPQRPPRGDRPRHRRAIPIGRDHRELDPVDLQQRRSQRLEPGGLDPVVVREQDPHLGPDPSGRPRTYARTERCYWWMLREDAGPDVWWRYTRVRGQSAAPPGAPRMRAYVRGRPLAAGPTVKRPCQLESARLGDGVFDLARAGGGGVVDDGSRRRGDRDT